MAGVWNHNIQYFPLILRVVASKPRSTAIDVGSGDGMLARAMADAVPQVVGLDSSLDRVEFCRSEYAGVTGLTFVHGDVLDPDLDTNIDRFDVVSCSATLHHLPLDAGLSRLRDLVAPGGTLVIVGLALEGTLGDHLISLLSVLVNRIAMARRGMHSHGAPTADPTETYSDIRSLAARVLPGARFRRHPYWRYSLIWERPLSV